MSVVDTLLGFGKAVVRHAVPYGGQLIDIIDEVSGDKEIPKDITATELAEVVKGLDGASVARIHESYNAVVMNSDDNWRKVQEAMAEVDKRGKSNRGEIAMLLTKCCIAWITILLGIIGYVAVTTKTFPGEWAIAAIFTFPFTIIGAYFGVKSSEIKKIADLKSPMSGTLKQGMISGLVGKIMK